MSIYRDIAYRLDPVPWVRQVLGVAPTAWQSEFLRAPRGASVAALTARQVGKTTTAAWAIGHAMLFYPGSLSVIASPAQRQSELFDRAIRTDGPLLPAGPAFHPVGEASMRIPNPFHNLKRKGVIL